MPNSIMPSIAGAQCRARASSAMPAQDNSVAARISPPRLSDARTRGSHMPAETPPTPITPRIAPYQPAPSSSCLCTTSGNNAQGAAAGTENAAERHIANRIAGVLRTKRTPARMALSNCSRGA